MTVILTGLNIGIKKKGNIKSYMYKLMHADVFFQLEVIEGSLVCPETGRKFPVSNGIPNMLLKEDEVWETSTG